MGCLYTLGKNVKEHLSSFALQIKEVAHYQPLFINAHSGRDAFTRSEASEFYCEAIKIEQDIGIAIAHETHRGRVFYNPWITRDLLLEYPELKLCCDYSHWVTVCERLLDEEKDILQSMPHTQQPLASLEEICLWQMQRQKHLFSLKFEQETLA